MTISSRHMTRCLALTATVALAAPAFAADAVVPIEPIQFEELYEGKPAVSGLNGKIELGYDYYRYDLIDGGIFDSQINARNIYGVGSVSAPLGQNFGVQVDAGLMQGFDDEIFGGFGEVQHQAYGIGAHLFWRDPDVALVGLYGHYLRVNRDTDLLLFFPGTLSFERETDIFRVAAAGEYYAGRFSLEGHVGADFLTTRLNLGPVELSRESATFLNAKAVAAFYPTDDTRIFAGAKYAFEEFAGVAGAEFMFASNSPVAPAVFVEGSYGQETASVNAGIRVYFGPEGKSLIRRHREDDPRHQLFDDLAIIGSCSATTGALPAMAVMDERPRPLHDGFSDVSFVEGPFDGYPSEEYDEDYSTSSSCGLSSDFDERDLPFIDNLR